MTETESKLAIMEWLLEGEPAGAEVSTHLDEDDMRLRALALSMYRAGKDVLSIVLAEQAWLNAYIDGHMINDQNPVRRVWRRAHIKLISNAGARICDWTKLST